MGWSLLFCPSRKRSGSLQPGGGWRDRRGEVLFIDARKRGHLVDRTRREFSNEEIVEIGRTYHAWRGEADAGEYEDVPGFCEAAALEDISEHNHVLTPGAMLAPRQPKRTMCRLRSGSRRSRKRLSSSLRRPRSLVLSFRPSWKRSVSMDENRTSTLEDMCELIVDCPHFTPAWTDTGYLVIRNQNFRGGRFNTSQPSFTNREDFERRIKRAKPQAGDIIFTREAPMGEVCMVPDGLECCVGQR